MCSVWSSAAIIPPSSSSSSATRICVHYRAATPTSSNSKMDSFLSRSRRRNYGFLTSNSFLFRLPVPTHKPNAPRPLILMEMQTCTVKMEVDVPSSVAYQCYSDREAIPKWMPFISSVKVLEDKPDQSRWTLKYKAFGRDIQFSWLARNLQPIPNQKIHWRSLEGLPNSGVVRFYPRGSSSCLIELSVSYEVPQLLAPVASALQPFLESLLIRGLERFSNFAKNRQTESPAN